MVFFTIKFSLFAYKQLKDLQLFDESFWVVLNINLLDYNTLFLSWTSTEKDLTLSRAYKWFIINNYVFGKK
jgi:hypothetical protein